MKTIMDIGEADNRVILEMDGCGHLYETNNAVTRERVTTSQRFGPGWDDMDVRELRSELEAAGWSHEGATLFIRRAFLRGKNLPM